jgi:hypothetical protein
MTTRERAFRTRVWLNPEPLENLITNPNAHYDLSDASSTNAALFRQVSGSVNSPYFTLFRLNASANAASWLNIGGDTGSVRLGLKPGKTYTVRGVFYLDSPLGGSADALARRIVAYTRVGAAAYVNTQSAQATNTAGVHALSVTFTTPAGMTEGFVRFFLGHTSGSGYWYGLTLTEGTSTDRWDGDTPSSDGINGIEYAWNGFPGRSTSRKVDRSGKTLIPDASLELSYDRNRVPFLSARITAPLPDDALIEALDPRRSQDVTLTFTVDQYTRTGVNGAFTTVEQSIPLGEPTDTAGKLWVDSIDPDDGADVLTITATSGEVVMDDKIRVSAATLDTGADNVAELVEYALSDCGQISALGGMGASGLTSVPAGDRQLWLSGEPAAQLYEAELSAIELRLFCSDIGRYWVAPYEEPPTNVPGGTPAYELEDGDDGLVYDAGRTIARRQGGWADAVLVIADYEDASGTRVVEYDRYPVSGQNHKGMVKRLARAIPSGYAESIVTRAASRGEAVRFSAHMDLACRVGREVDFTVQGRATRTVTPDRIMYRPDAGTMEIEGTYN